MNWMALNGEVPKIPENSTIGKNLSLSRWIVSMKEKEKNNLKTETIENREINLKQILVKEVSDNLLSKV